MKKIFISTLIFIIFFELLSVIFTRFDFFLINEKPKYSYEKKFKHDWIKLDKFGGTWHKKNYMTKHVSRCFDVTYQTNNVGARDNDDYFKDKNKKSIMLIGDSFAEGPGVELNKIFAKIVENKLEKKVLNFGNAGSDPSSQYTRYINDTIEYNFDNLIYFFLPQNDYSINANTINQKKNINIDNEKKYFSLANLKYQIVDFLARFTYSYNFLRSFSYAMDIKLNYGYDNLSYFIKDKKKINHTLNFVEKIISSKKVKTYIVIIPTIYDINLMKKRKYKELYWYKKINQIAASNNSTLIDLMDHVDYEKRYRYFHSCDGHWSEFGNKFAAEVFIKKFYK